VVATAVVFNEVDSIQKIGVNHKAANAHRRTVMATAVSRFVSFLPLRESAGLIASPLG
jgi:hypothetical protein